jgi:hypothetical protein
VSANGTPVVPRPGKLAAREKAALGTEILVAYARSRWLLRSTTLPDALDRLRSSGADEPVPGDPVYTGARLGHAVVRTLSVLPTDSRCLVRSLVLSRLLARRGIEARLVLGVRPGDDFAAHAWVECGEVPVLPTGDGEYQRLTEV